MLVFSDDMSSPVRPSVRLSVSLSSVVCNVRAPYFYLFMMNSYNSTQKTQAIEIFGNVSTPFGKLTLAISRFRVKFFTEIVPGKRFGRGEGSQI